jgi:anti-sigma regulatory factor (Ser/Thr protein kinase)
VASSSARFPDPPSRGLPLPSPTSDAMYHTYRSDLSQVRALVLQQAREAGLAEGRANDLVLAVSEVAANTLRHTRSSGTLAIWHDEEEVVCEIRDEGRITDPHVGRIKPSLDASGGHGLWIVRQVCDLVELTSDANGTMVRMHMALRPHGTARAGAPAGAKLWYKRVWTYSRRQSRRSSREASRTRWWRSSEKPT